MADTPERPTLIRLEEHENAEIMAHELRAGGLQYLFDLLALQDHDPTILEISEVAAQINTPDYNGTAFAMGAALTIGFGKRLYQSDSLADVMSTNLRMAINVMNDARDRHAVGVTRDDAYLHMMLALASEAEDAVPSVKELVDKALATGSIAPSLQTAFRDGANFAAIGVRAAEEIHAIVRAW